MVEIKRFGALSAGKILGVLYLVLGLILGLMMGFLTLIFALVGAAAGSNGDVAAGMLGFGVAGFIFYVVVLPLLYGLLGFLSGLVGAGVYNLVVRFTGGLEVELGGEALRQPGGAGL